MNRRDFLKGFAFVGTALSLGVIIKSQFVQHRKTLTKDLEVWLLATGQRQLDTDLQSVVAEELQRA